MRTERAIRRESELKLHTTIKTEFVALSILLPVNFDHSEALLLPELTAMRSFLLKRLKAKSLRSQSNISDHIAFGSENDGCHFRVNSQVKLSPASGLISDKVSVPRPMRAEFHRLRIRKSIFRAKLICIFLTVGSLRFFLRPGRFLAFLFATSDQKKSGADE